MQQRHAIQMLAFDTGTLSTVIVCFVEQMLDQGTKNKQLVKDHIAEKMFVQKSDHWTPLLVDQTDQTDTRPDTSTICHVRCTLAHANGYVFQQQRDGSSWHSMQQDSQKNTGKCCGAKQGCTQRMWKTHCCNEAALRWPVSLSLNKHS